MLDLDNGIEKRFGKDVVNGLGGIGNQQLIANIRDEETGVFHGKRLSTSDSSKFEKLTNSQWHSSNGWLYYHDVNELQLENEKFRIDITTSRDFSPLFLEEDTLLFCKSWNTDLEYMRLDLKNSTYTTGKTMDYTLEAWSEFLTDLNSSGIPFAQENDQGIKIIVKKK